MGRMKTSDGYAVLGAIEDYHFRSLVEIMGNPDWVTGEDWYIMWYRINHLMDIAPMLDEWMGQQQKDDIHHRVAQKGIAIGPINSAKDVFANEQYIFRDYFVDVEHPEAGKHRYAGWPYQMTATPPRVGRPAPLLGQHNQEVFCNDLGYSSEEFEHLKQLGAL